MKQELIKIIEMLDKATEILKAMQDKVNERIVGVKMLDSTKKTKLFIIGGAASDAENQDRIKKALHKIYSDQAVVCTLTKDQVDRLEDQGYMICTVDPNLKQFAR